MGNTAQKVELTNERSMKDGEIENSMEKIILRETSLMGLGQIERREKKTMLDKEVNMSSQN